MLLLVVSSCSKGKKQEEGNYTSFENCKYKSPVALFGPKFKDIKKHQFQQEKTYSIEQVVFENGVALELTQSGCNKARQEFKFILKGDFSGRSEQEWISVAAGLFQFLSSIDHSLMEFHNWSKAIKDKKTMIHIGQPMEVQPGFLVAIDRIVGPDITTLVVVLTEI